MAIVSPPPLLHFLCISALRLRHRTAFNKVYYWEYCIMRCLHKSLIDDLRLFLPHTCLLLSQCVSKIWCHSLLAGCLLISELPYWSHTSSVLLWIASSRACSSKMSLAVQKNERKNHKRVLRVSKRQFLWCTAISYEWTDSDFTGGNRVVADSSDYFVRYFPQRTTSWSQSIYCSWRISS